MPPQTRDPRTAHPQPPQPSQGQQHPGSERDLQPPADHGERSYRGSDRLRDKVAVITGADSGIGRAIALAYAREGADVVIGYLSEEEDAQETRRLIEDAGRRATLVLPGAVLRDPPDGRGKERVGPAHLLRHQVGVRRIGGDARAAMRVVLPSISAEESACARGDAGGVSRHPLPFLTAALKMQRNRYPFGALRTPGAGSDLVMDREGRLRRGFDLDDGMARSRLIS